MTRRAVVAALLVALAAAGCGDRAPGPTSRVRLATTTSTAETGLLDHLLAPFEAREGVAVDVVSVGTGLALDIGRRGDADLLVVHDRAREDEFVARGDGVDRRDLWWNDFVVAGPEEDPAGIRGLSDAAEAFRKVAASGALFVSRADKSGTHGRETALWDAAGVRPPKEAYWEAGQGMSATLTIADEKKGYTLADRGSWLAHRKRLRLVLLVEGDARLRNPYGGIVVNPARHPHANAAGARRLLDWLTSPEGRSLLASFTRDGEVLFHPPD